MMAGRRAVVSVSNRDGLGEFVGGLQGIGFEFYATRGTRAALAKQGIQVDSVEELTGEGELLGGRVKTIHPNIHAAILARRDAPEHMADLKGRGIRPIDLVVVNLYPFAQAARNPEATVEKLQEEVDIGGVALIRAAAKNFRYVAAVVDPSQYRGVLREYREQGDLSAQTRETLALAAFAYTSGYDAAIYNDLCRRLRPSKPLPPALRLALDAGRDLRYGENPYQVAAFYRNGEARGPSVATARQLMGRELSYNNILDFNAALELALRFERPTAVIIKHTNPAGVASADGPLEAYLAAREADPRSAYGCVMAFNVGVNGTTAAAMKGHFVEGIIAPEFTPEALANLGSKRDVRILRYHPDVPAGKDLQVSGIRGGVLVQTRGYPILTRENLRVVTRRSPSREEIEAMLFASRVLGHVKSNAIVLAKGERTVGIGAGQMSRIDSVMLACLKAGEGARGSVMASDAFFPFRDGIDEAAKGGVTAVLQPGGSKRDAEVVQAAEEHGMAMVVTGIRMFRH